jgi:adenine phosphoribosyltransferase
MSDLKSLIVEVPDFPKAGILFRDITPVLANPVAFNQVTDALCGLARLSGATHIVGIESRGFLFGVGIAQRLSLPFVPVRKPGKLPRATRRAEYALEYGTDAVEMHVDAVAPGDRVVVIDDLLATGGTAEAACRLIEASGAHVGAVLVVIELAALGGVARLAPRPVHALLRY